jgi:hypothetical protein
MFASLRHELLQSKGDEVGDPMLETFNGFWRRVRGAMFELAADLAE